MPDQNKTHIVVVLDRSGSMSTILQDTKGGFDTFIEAQRELPGECTVTLAQFDTLYEVVYKDKPLADVPPLTLSPRGGTALLDGIGRTVVTVGEDLAKLPEEERPGSVILVILTDGEENSSVEYTLDQIKTMLIEQQEKYSWLVQFFGASLDAIDVATAMGITTASAMVYTGQNVAQAFAGAARSSTSFRGSMANGASYSTAVGSAAFTDDERTAASGI